MPTISESKKGEIKIAVNYSDHNPPHFHVIKGKEPKWIDWTID